MGVIKSFFTEPLQMYGSKAPEKKSVLKAVEDMGHSSVDATVGVTSNYVRDIINPGFDGLKSLGNLVNPKAYKDNGFLGNLMKSPAGFVTREATALKNVAGGLIGGVGHAYQKGIIDNSNHILGATLDRIPYLGTTLANALRLVVNTPALVGKAPSLILSQIDKFFDGANTKTARTGKEIPQNILRI